MKHTFIQINVLAALMCCAGLVSAQSSKVKERVHLPVSKPSMMKAMPMPEPVTGLESYAAPTPSVPPAQGMMSRSVVEEIAGATAYDNQTNGTEQRRLHVWPDGNVSTVWCHSEEEETSTAASSYTDRGSAYNTRSQWLGGSVPTTRVENVRTGFPNYVVTDNGTELIFAHRVQSGNYFIRQSRRAAGETTWTQSDIPSTAPKGSLWCKAVADGNTVYVLSLTVPTGTLGGVLYQGMNGQVLMHRSKDAGLTWERVDYIIPGLDQTKFAQLTSDSYAIDARDGVVAVALFDGWNDATLFKSEDGGDTWNDPITIVDFPLEKYTTDTPYTVDDIGGADPNGPAENTDLEIFTTDGNGTILIDNAGFVHIWVGRMWVVDTDFSTAGRSYYPGINGLMYWNELDPENLYVIAGAPDLNGNDTLDILGTQITNTGCNISSMATSAISINDTLYVALSVAMEEFLDASNGCLRHVILIKSGDYGQTWEDMYDVHYATNDQVLADLQEGTRPYFVKRVGTDGILHMVYQRDYDAGFSVSNNEDPPQYLPGKTDIVYIATVVSSSAHTPNQVKNFQVSPNPASNQVRVGFDAENNGDARIELFDAFGKMVYNQHFNASAGMNAQYINTAAFSAGTYFVKVSTAGAVGCQKLSIVK